jgi:hypothetical protein
MNFKIYLKNKLLRQKCYESYSLYLSKLSLEGIIKLSFYLNKHDKNKEILWVLTPYALLNESASEKKKS